LGQITKGFRMINSRPVDMKSTDASLLGIEEIKLPVVTYMNDLTWHDIHLFTYPEVKIWAF